MVSDRRHAECCKIVIDTMSWQLADAKNRFSELVRRALTEGPQKVSLRGKDVVVILSVHEFEKLSAKKPSFKEMLRSGPIFDGLDLSRDAEKGRVSGFKVLA